jgi:hypothetical protein
MTTSPARNSRCARPAVSHEHTPCHFMIVYQDHTTLERALGLYQRIRPGLNADMEFECTQWRMDELEMAAAEAADAQVIIFSGHAGTPVSPSLKGWIDAWLPSAAAADIALVLLLDNLPANSPADCRLAEIVETAALEQGVDFFSEVERSSGRHSSRVCLHQP